MGKNNFENDSTGINILSYGTNIEGNIVCNSDIRIDGGLIGNLTTSGKLVIGPSGSIHGEINCKNGDISGVIEGKINATELLALKATAKLYGDININKLAVEPGCIFIGNCKMTAEVNGNVKAIKSRSEEFESEKAKIY